MTRAFSVDSHRVAHETIDGETILINIETGCYYSSGATGAEIWELVRQGCDEREITGRLEAEYAAGPGEIAGDVKRFLDGLIADNLVVESESAGEKANAGRAATGGKKWVAPKLEKYDDLQDLLLADPIHDVEDTGWPHRKPIAN